MPSIGGGSDTTAITIGAVLYYLIKSPSVMYRLRQELNEKRSQRQLSWPVKLKESLSCAYLQATIKETMRIYPGNGLPLPGVVPEGGLMIAGRHFPAGVRLLHLFFLFDTLILQHSFILCSIESRRLPSRSPRPKKPDAKTQLADHRRHQRLGRQIQ